jgi:hypothetical protein
MNKTSNAALSVLFLLFGAQGIRIAAADEPAHPEPHAQSRGPEPAPARPAAPAPARPSAPPPRAMPANGVPAHPVYDTHGQALDARYNHGRYYPPVGTVRPYLPPDYRPYYHGGHPYYFNGGIWYAPRGPGFVVVVPPPGLVISVLPPYYSTVWSGGVPYYYADNVYYSWQPDQNGYAVVDPPEDAAAAPPPPPDTTQQDLIIYPKNGQGKEQQAADQFDCNNWAKGQTGFDPTEPDGGAQGGEVNRNNYDRAMSACLQARGYQVN